jgi:hypothetical protein
VWLVRQDLCPSCFKLQFYFLADFPYVYGQTRACTVHAGDHLSYCNRYDMILQTLKVYVVNAFMEKGSQPQRPSTPTGGVCSGPPKPKPSDPRPPETSGIQSSHRIQRTRNSRFWICLLLVLFLLVSHKVAPSPWPISMSINEFISMIAPSKPAADFRIFEPDVEVEYSPTCGPTDNVRFDNYSLILKGQRIFLQ